MPSSLIKKLRIQPGQRLLIVNAPVGYLESLGDLPEGVVVETSGDGPFDFVHVFAKDREEYASLGPAAVAAVKYDGLLWISYPKGSSRVKTDLSRDMMWELVADARLRPVTQISIDPVWTALRFRPAEAVGK